MLAQNQSIMRRTPSPTAEQERMVPSAKRMVSFLSLSISVLIWLSSLSSFISVALTRDSCCWRRSRMRLRSRLRSRRCPAVTLSTSNRSSVRNLSMSPRIRSLSLRTVEMWLSNRALISARNTSNRAACCTDCFSPSDFVLYLASFRSRSAMMSCERWRVIASACAVPSPPPSSRRSSAIVSSGYAARGGGSRTHGGSSHGSGARAR
mmetsp:Transcript_26750/g.87760  ORF Transcript_26750/g.87760 Transcript_26750/m.87760 type:complete len:207 (+) Transcript_26750:442-1062(+)